MNAANSSWDAPEASASSLRRSRRPHLSFPDPQFVQLTKGRPGPLHALRAVLEPGVEHVGLALQLHEFLGFFLQLLPPPPPPLAVLDQSFPLFPEFLQDFLGVLGQKAAAGGAGAIGAQGFQLPDAGPELPAPVPIGQKMGFGVLPLPMPLHGLGPQISPDLGNAPTKLQELRFQLGHAVRHVLAGPGAGS